MVSRQDKWSLGKCFDFAEKCSASIKFGPGPNGNSANVREEKFQFCLLADAGPAILWDERTSGAPTAKSPRLNVTNNPSTFLQLLSLFDQVLLIFSLVFPSLLSLLSTVPSSTNNPSPCLLLLSPFDQVLLILLFWTWPDNNRGEGMIETFTCPIHHLESSWYHHFPIAPSFWSWVM